eukprot:TRINITY_DN9842_c0_g3_i1.p1 TRINITY_DN9842_c0_g3~~TRINITY_DN9842_c0_g3_i1.p1  ORF type:complete len:292 (-),score=109.43 TRINITY_DN9842_c0_g3_i1:18-893(-)
MKSENSANMQIRIAIHGFEGEKDRKPSSVYGVLKIEREKIGSLNFGSHSLFPLPKLADTFQILVHDVKTNLSLGSLTMMLDEILSLPSRQGKHWVTLFDDSDDDVYDGDYVEDDMEAPRVLISYEVMKAQDALNETQGNDRVIFGSKTEERLDTSSHKVSECDGSKEEAVITEPEESKTARTITRIEYSRGGELEDSIDMPAFFSRMEGSRGSCRVEESGVKVVKETVERCENGVVVREYRSYVEESKAGGGKEKKSKIEEVSADEGGNGKPQREEAVSYTHLTLPTNREV